MDFHLEPWLHEENLHAGQTGLCSQAFLRSTVLVIAMERTSSNQNKQWVEDYYTSKARTSFSFVLRTAFCLLYSVLYLGGGEPGVQLQRERRTTQNSVIFRGAMMATHEQDEVIALDDISFSAGCLAADDSTDEILPHQEASNTEQPLCCPDTDLCRCDSPDEELRYSTDEILPHQEASNTEQPLCCPDTDLCRCDSPDEELRCVILSQRSFIGLDRLSVYGQNHSRRLCSEDEFTCASGQCVAQDSICDSQRDCSDASDEDPLTCSFVMSSEDASSSDIQELVQKAEPEALVLPNRTESCVVIGSLVTHLIVRLAEPLCQRAFRNEASRGRKQMANKKKKLT
ncbi:hypothetical protein H920_16982 [Fukomys damarensis]|uniref:Uncharacterized protein n=1 Tax=Fukomys damarensis TaxID=885580 RepID=A0A091CVA3_FUKDA|nr:hypothetical protein H920_16982 [Fukomys damarensis]